MNYEVMLDLISLDAPEQSRLLAKVLPEDEPASIQHAGPLLTRDDGLFTLLRDWIEMEQAARCPDCGLAAENTYLAYTRRLLYWALERSRPGPTGVCATVSKIRLQPSRPKPYGPGAPIDSWGTSSRGQAL